jgi:predicted nucleic acid-binding Zn ribbon protein
MMERIDREIERTLARSGSGQAVELSRVTAAWPEAVGEAVARNAWPLRIGRDGTLHVATSSATWAFELDRLSPELGGRLKAVLGDAAPQILRFRVGPVPESGASSQASGQSVTTGPEPPLEAVREADSAAAEIEDPELRELVRRAARASLARARSDRAF